MQIAPISGAIDQDIHAFPTNSNTVRLLGSSKTRFKHDISHQRLLDDKIVLTGAEQTAIHGTQLFIKNSVLEATKIYG